MLKARHPTQIFGLKIKTDHNDRLIKSNTNPIITEGTPTRYLSLKSLFNQGGPSRSIPIATRMLKEISRVPRIKIINERTFISSS